MRAHHTTANLAAEVALELIDRTHVQTAYDQSGRLSHLVATLPRKEFFKLYPASTTASVFIQGHWLQVSLARQTGAILSRLTGIKLRIEIASNECGATLLRIFHTRECVVSRKVSRLSPNDLQDTSEGLQVIAKAAIRALEKIGDTPKPEAQSTREFCTMPCVHVVPEPEPVPEFRSEWVLLQ